MSKTEPKWEQVRNEAAAILAEHADKLGVKTIDSVNHYLDHEEYEMAVEGLCLDLLSLDDAEVDWPRCVSLASVVGLDKVSVFDSEFWSKLSAKVAS
ncbi:hypothetical protein [Enhygromyxa salina]|uniref:hypothetical protein n=1 Tax=Enhygromyxa salina TaxID=215803 RepID=UPI000695C724|nr:hypothetical protein [Enhygromyxa salina]